MKNKIYLASKATLPPILYYTAFFKTWSHSRNLKYLTEENLELRDPLMLVLQAPSKCHLPSSRGLQTQDAFCCPSERESPNLGQAFFSSLQAPTYPMNYSQLLPIFILPAQPLKAFQFATFVLKVCFRFGCLWPACAGPKRREASVPSPTHWGCL